MIVQVAVRTQLCLGLYFFKTFSRIVFTFAGDLVHFMVAVRSQMVAVRSDGANQPYTRMLEFVGDWCQCRTFPRRWIGRCNSMIFFSLF